MIFLKEIKFDKSAITENEFPFNIPLVKNLKNLNFDSPMTILVGENGTGKSTLLEAVACAVESITIGNENVKTDKTLEHARKLASGFKLTWQVKTHRGFFMRAEDFFNFTKRTNQSKLEMEQELAMIKEEYKNHSKFTQSYATAPLENSIHDIESRYGKDLDANSHGESFMKIFKTRFVPKGLYILDEPEAPLSPIKQYAFMMLLKDMIDNKDAQFIIATHSPILMAFPKATILRCDTGKLQPKKYEDLEQVNFMKEFLNNPENYTKRL